MPSCFLQRRCQKSPAAHRCESMSRLLILLSHTVDIWISDCFPDLPLNSFCFIFTISSHHVVNVIPAYQVVYIPTVCTERIETLFKFWMLWRWQIYVCLCKISILFLLSSATFIAHCYSLWQTQEPLHFSW